jgi:hypothetical protein
MSESTPQTPGPDPAVVARIFDELVDADGATRASSTSSSASSRAPTPTEPQGRK